MTFHENTQGFRAIIEKSMDGLLVVDENRIIRFLNPKAESLLNQKREDLLGELFEYSVEEDEPLEIDIIRENGKSGTGELRVVHIDWDNRKAYLVSIRDITKRIALDKLKDEFISNVSHELRTPLTTIREAVAQISEGILGEINSEQSDFLSLCLKNTDRLRRIVDDLLDISRIESGKIKLHKKRTNLSELTRSALSPFIPLMKKSGLGLKVTLSKKPIEGYIDPDRIIQVLNNLVGNALKFTEKGSIHVTIENQSETVACKVIDTGIGIAEEDLPNVFDKFKQFGRDTHQGTGLGLSISKEIVRLHGGNILVESVLNQGSTFTFTLPSYNLDLEICEKIQNRIIGSKEPFLCFYSQLHNFDEIKKNGGSEYVKEHRLRIKRLLENMNKSVIPTFFEADDQVLFLVNTTKSEPALNKQLIRILKEASFGAEDDTELDFTYGTALYPKDAKNARDLLNFCRENMVLEKEARFNKTILAVDDKVELTEETKTLLSMLGYKQIITANDGEEVFKILQKRIPDLFILDMKMPGMSGYEVIGRLKESFETQEIPILIMSGYEVETGRLNEYINKKAILTISKPANVDVLRKMVYFLI